MTFRDRKHGSARIAIAAFVAVLALPATASAIPIPGPNGKLVFTSGRGAAPNDDSKANLYTFEFPGGPAVQLTNVAVQHSHPGWSPDRTKVAYSLGPDGARDIIIRDVLTGVETDPFATAANEDRPAYSPDGKMIAFTQGPDVMVHTFATGVTVTLTDTVAEPADKAAWSPDSKTIYYARGDIGTNAAGIWKENASNVGAPVKVIDVAGVNEWQASISPDGTKLCYTRGPKSSAAQVYTVASSGVGTPQNFSNSNNGGINCVFSPDGTKIAYTKGTFFDGELGYKNADGTGQFVQLSDTPMHFEGNGDWVLNPPPTCSASAVTVAFNSFVSIPLACTDPAPESETTSKDVATKPAHGNLGSVKNSAVIYTPDLNFSGTDSFTFTGNDGTSDSAAAKVTITVNKAGGGGGGGNTDDKTAPVLSATGVSPARWRLGSSLPKFAAAKGTTIRFRVSEMAVVNLTFAKPATGRRVGRRCVAPKRSNRSRARCTRYVNKGTVRVIAKVGANRLRFQGKLSARRKLGLGRHRLTLSAVDGAGNKSKSRTAFFTIVRR